MEASNTTLSAPLTLRQAHARLLKRYADFADHMLTLTFKPDRFGDLPTQAEVHDQLRHLSCCWATHIWGNRVRFNKKCRVLFLPVVEGAKGQKRIHAHVLVGNVGDKKAICDFIDHYINKKALLAAERYDVTWLYDAAGISRYLTKEIEDWNEDAVAWEIASIPPALLPKK